MNTLFIIGIILRIVGISSFVFFVIPKMYRETRTVDGLKTLRFLIPVITSLYVLGNTVALFVNSCLVLGCSNNEQLAIGALINSANLLVISIVLIMIYHKKWGD